MVADCISSKPCSLANLDVMTVIVIMVYIYVRLTYALIAIKEKSSQKGNDNKHWGNSLKFLVSGFSGSALLY